MTKGLEKFTRLKKVNKNKLLSVECLVLSCQLPPLSLRLFLTAQALAELFFHTRPIYSEHSRIDIVWLFPVVVDTDEITKQHDKTTD